MALSRTTWVSRYQKGKTNLDFTEARDSEWQWHQLDHMQVCISLQTDNHANTPPLSFLQAGCPSCRPSNSVKSTEGTRFTCIMAVKRVVVLVGIFYYFVCVFFISFVACVCVLIGLSLVYVLILSFVLGQLSVLCSLPVQLSMNRYCLWSLWMYRFEQNKMKWYEMKLLYNCIF